MSVQAAMIAVCEAIKGRRYTLTSQNYEACRITFKTGMSMNSFSGQRMSAAFREISPNTCQLTFRGEMSNSGIQVFDWNESAQIARKILNDLAAGDQSAVPFVQPVLTLASTIASGHFRLGYSGALYIFFVICGIFGILFGGFGWSVTEHITPAIMLDSNQARQLNMKPGEIIPALTYDREQTHKERGDNVFYGLFWLGLGAALLVRKYYKATAKMNTDTDVT